MVHYRRTLNKDRGVVEYCSLGVLPVERSVGQRKPVAGTEQEPHWLSVYSLVLFVSQSGNGLV